MSVLNSPTLVLNKSWHPIRVETIRRSLPKVFSGVAKLFDEETYVPYTWDEWVNLFSFDSDDNDAEELGYDFIRSSKIKVRKPEIIILTEFNKIPRNKVRLTRRNLLIRDRFTCQYTGKRLNSRNATMDHVLPKSRGGKTEWKNLVICSLDANVKKANRTPEEAGLILKNKPKEPTWNPMYSFFVKNKPKSWDKFINTDKWNEVGYWDVELID
jgi:5-methylcytosine-specific restriction endonuclease McrA